MPGRHWILTSSALPKGHAILGREAMTLGREPRCELRLYAPDVSRRHARITRSARGYAIQDLGSANGTLVNGRSALRPIPLENEDLVTVGTVQLQFLIVDAERDEIAQRFSPGIEETDHVVQAEASAAAIFKGQFTRETLHQVCQLIEFHKHAGVLRVETGGTVGYLRFREGLVVDARFGPTTGERAARALLGSLAGDYAFHRAGANAAGGELRLQALALVMEVLRSEESQERRAFAEGFADDADGRALTPPRGARTQRILRKDVPDGKGEKPPSSDEWKALFRSPG